MLDEKTTPSEQQVLKAIGAKRSELWKDLLQFLDSGYDFTAEFEFLGEKYGWAFRYRRKGKTLCTLFPETDAFTVLVTLGKKEVRELSDSLSRVNKRTRQLFEETRQYHDGKWMYKRILNGSDIRDVKFLIALKKKPRA
jgi:hypothetical protein